MTSAVADGTYLAFRLYLASGFGAPEAFTLAPETVLFERPRNAFLRALPQSAFEQLAPHLQPMTAVLGREIYSPGERLTHVYFPERCLLSLLSRAHDGDTVETQMCGNEGGAGLLEAFGSGVSSVSALVQVDGPAFSAPVQVVRDLVRRDENFSHQSWTLSEMQLNESRQSGLCHARHPAEHRLARWLVESWERSGGRNPMPLTQEFIAAMLGVQRTTVTSVAIELQKKGLIAYSRGRVELCDIEGLQARACECHAVIQSDRRRLEMDALNG